MSNTQAERVERLMELVDAHGAERWSTGYEDANSPLGSPESAAHDAKAFSVRRELHTEIAALLADAERYRWLREIGHEQVRVLAHYAGPALDAAIDAARNTTQQQGG